MQALSIPFIEGIFCQEVRRLAQAAGVECISAQRARWDRFPVKDHLPTQTNRPQLSRSFLIKTEHIGSPGEVCNLKWLITPKIQAIGNRGKSSIPERKPGINSLEAEIKN